MAQPLVSWFKRTNGDADQLTKWDIGVVDAGTVSNDFTFLIWNNRKGTSAVSNMEDAVITTKDELGGTANDLVEGQWVEVKVNSLDETTFNKIGYDTPTTAVVSRPVGTNKSTSFNSTVSTPNQAPNTSTNGTVSILGVANDGDYNNAKGNYAEVTLHARIPGNASAGLIKFLTRISYKYV